MASVNKVILVGNLGNDPEVRYLPSGDAVANISLATTDKYKEKATGNTVENTEWHRVAFFGKLAEIVNEYLKKGAQVYLEGRIRTRKYQAQDGTDRYSTEIIADKMVMLGGRSEGGERQPQRQRPADGRAAGQAAQRQPAGGSGGGGFAEMDDDIPFSPRGARAAWSAE